jgi:deoxyribose-phosphate aldolase
MQIELNCHYRAAKKSDIQKAAFAATEYDFSALSVCYPYLDTTIELIGHNIVLACPIDYPFGLNTTTIKLQQLAEAAKRNISIADLVVNNFFVVNKLWNKLNNEIDQFVEFCRGRGIEPRAIIEYKLLDRKQLLNLCKILKQRGIHSVITETGNIQDCLNDSLIVANEILKEVNLKVFLDTNIITAEDFALVERSNVDGLRLRHPDFVPKILRVPQKNK